MFKDIKLALVVAKDMKENPHLWSSDNEFWAWRAEKDLKVWIAVKAAALRLHTERETLWDVTMWCVLGGSPAQHIVYHAYKKYIFTSIDVREKIKNELEK